MCSSDLPGDRTAAERVLALVDVDGATTDERLFYFDVKAQALRQKKDWTGAVAILEKALPLARNEEERNALELSLETVRKEIPAADAGGPMTAPNSPMKELP